MDHAVELEVTDWAGESDLTVTLSADSSLTLVAAFEVVKAFEVVQAYEVVEASAGCSLRSSVVIRSMRANV